MILNIFRSKLSFGSKFNEMFQTTTLRKRPQGQVMIIADDAYFTQGSYHDCISRQCVRRQCGPPPPRGGARGGESSSQLLEPPPAPPCLPVGRLLRKEGGEHTKRTTRPVPRRDRPLSSSGHFTDRARSDESARASREGWLLGRHADIAGSLSAQRSVPGGHTRHPK